MEALTVEQLAERDRSSHSETGIASVLDVSALGSVLSPWTAPFYLAI